MVYSTRLFVLSFALCYFVLVFFSLLSIVISSNRELRERERERERERANLSAFRTFVRFAICVCLVISVFSSSWCLGKAVACDCGTP